MCKERPDVGWLPPCFQTLQCKSLDPVLLCLPLFLFFSSVTWPLLEARLHFLLTCNYDSDLEVEDTEWQFWSKEMTMCIPPLSQSPNKRNLPPWESRVNTGAQTPDWDLPALRDIEAAGRVSFNRLKHKLRLIWAKHQKWIGIFCYYDPVTSAVQSQLARDR